MLGGELCVALRRIDAHAENHRVLRKDFAVMVADTASLGGATGRVVFGVEIQDDFFATKAGEAYGLAVAKGSAHGCGGEIGGWIAGLEVSIHRHRV